MKHLNLETAALLGMAVVFAGPCTLRVEAVSPLPSYQSAPPDHAVAQAQFSKAVAGLSGDAKPVDGLWSGFVTACKVKPVAANDGREWFGLWDGRVQADYSTGQCRELFNQIVASGETIKKGMASAEDVARKSLTPAEMRDIRKLNLMDWDGFSLAPPQKREP